MLWAHAVKNKFRRIKEGIVDSLISEQVAHVKQVAGVLTV